MIRWIKKLFSRKKKYEQYEDARTAAIRSIGFKPYEDGEKRRRVTRDYIVNSLSTTPEERFEELRNHCMSLVDLGYRLLDHIDFGLCLENGVEKYKECIIMEARPPQGMKWCRRDEHFIYEQCQWCPDCDDDEKAYAGID